MIWFLVVNATFNNISAISWRPAFVAEEAWVTGENHRPSVINWYREEEHGGVEEWILNKVYNFVLFYILIRIMT
jgi:hypothetical protein